MAPGRSTSALDEALRAAGITTARTLCPITDPYVAHHAPLGSLAWLHVSDDDGQVVRARGAGRSPRAVP
jgi:hypothetical protein